MSRFIEVYPSVRSSSAETVNSHLAASLEEVAASPNQYVSFSAVGGTGFGDFNSRSSDIDTWTIIRNASNSTEQLEAIRTIHALEVQMQMRAIGKGVLQSHNFRHPSSIFTESEAETYKRAFAAKIGLPISLGVFPTLSGKDQQAIPPAFSSEELSKDLAYSSYVFYSNTLTPPSSGLEDIDRYIFKRATYFLRFKALLDNQLYIPSRTDVIDFAQEVPEWNALVDQMVNIENGTSLSTKDTAQFQTSIIEAMRHSLSAYEQNNLLEADLIKKGMLRTQMQWILEKLRWDYLLLDRDTETLGKVLSNGPTQLWGYPFERIDTLFQDLFTQFNDPAIALDWDTFKKSHLEFVSEISNEKFLQTYYSTVFHPRIIDFFAMMSVHIGKLF